MSDEASSHPPAVKCTTFVRRVPCKRCLSHYAQYPTKLENINGSPLVACCEDSNLEDKFKKYQVAGRKALFKMKNRSRARNRRTEKDITAMKERAREARAVTDLKIRLDMANSLSVLANAASIYVSNRWYTNVTTYDREVADSYQGVLDDEADEIEYAESNSDEEAEEQTQ
ncbi:hypothetical protein GGI35DRAFT_473183 [Trichoderma velutinum]